MTLANDDTPDHRPVPPRRLLADAKEGAARLHMPLSSFYDGVRAARFSSFIVRVGRRIKVDLERLEAFMDAGGNTTTDRQQ